MISCFPLTLVEHAQVTRTLTSSALLMVTERVHTLAALLPPLLWVEFLGEY